MKSLDLIKFIVIIIVSFVLGILFFNKPDFNYSDLITFLSIMIGFEIASFSILFSSPLKKYLYMKKNKIYQTELHRLKAYYKHALYFAAFSILLVFVMPKEIQIKTPKIPEFVIGKHIIIFPILFGTIYCFYKICDDLFRIFVFPTND